MPVIIFLEYFTMTNVFYSAVTTVSVTIPVRCLLSCRYWVDDVQYFVHLHHLLQHAASLQLFLPLCLVCQGRALEGVRQLVEQPRYCTIPSSFQSEFEAQT